MSIPNDPGTGIGFELAHQPRIGTRRVRFDRAFAFPVPPKNESFVSLERDGSFRAKSQLPAEKLNWISNIAAERAAAHSYSRSNGYPFVDLLQDEDFSQPDNPIIDQVLKLRSMASTSSISFSYEEIFPRTA